MSSSTSPTKSTSSNNILSSKVQRALQLRTDTPAMTNALDSLAALHHANRFNTNSTTSSTNTKTSSTSTAISHSIDARNVRNAIEEDALYQARLLESELSNLVSMVATMRGSIQDVLHVAESVGKGLETGVLESGAVAGNKKQTMAEESKLNFDTHDAVMTTDNADDDMTNSNSLFEEERKLAALLADAFHEREDAMKRYDTISEFLEKYDLNQKDSLLLENYNFEDIFDIMDPSLPHNRNKKTVRFDQDGTGGSDSDELNVVIKDGDAFLNALERVTNIRKELSSTFEDDTNPKSTTIAKSSAASHLGATSAMRMVESLASKQERAFERLYHFLHNHLDLNQTASMAHVPTSSNAAKNAYRNTANNAGGGGGEDDDGMDESLGHPFIKRALIVLRHVPAYYTHTLELIATSRRSEVTRKFLLALTSGYNGMAPIEMKAHDPVNYVGDMLAFVFRAVSVESELAKGLVLKNGSGSGSGDRNETYGPDNDEFSSIFMSASDVLNDALGGVARPLKSRLLQVIGSLARRPDDEDDPNNLLHESGFADEEADTARIRLAHLFSICGLILFYQSAIGKAIDKLEKQSGGADNVDNVVEDGFMTASEGSSFKLNNPLITCLSESLEDAAKAYVASIKVYCAMLDHLASISNESQANLCHTVILRLCDVRATSPGFGLDFEKDTAGIISESAAEALSLEYLCDTVMEAIMPSCNNIDDIVSIKSALNRAKKAGLKSESALKWEASLLEEEGKIIEEQIRNDTNYVLDECGLGSIASALESMKAVYIEGMVISSHPGLSELSLQAAMKEFYASLIDPPFPSYDNIKDPVLRKRSRNKIAGNVADIYEEIYNLVSSENGGYEDLSFLGHSPDQVRSLIISS